MEPQLIDSRLRPRSIVATNVFPCLGIAALELILRTGNAHVGARRGSVLSTSVALPQRPGKSALPMAHSVGDRSESLSCGDHSGAFERSKSVQNRPSLGWGLIQIHAIMMAARAR